WPPEDLGSRPLFQRGTAARHRARCRRSGRQGSSPKCCGGTMNTILLFGLVALAVGGLVWVLVYPMLSGERKAEQRKQAVTRSMSAIQAKERHTPGCAVKTSRSRSERSRRAVPRPDQCR